jgi:Tfp pilus assembly protein PilX
MPFRKKLKKYIKSDGGAALGITIMILLVLSILGISFISIGYAESRNVIYQDKSMQAFYLARSGADAVSSWIVKNPGQAASLDGKVADSQGQFPNGKVEMQVNHDALNKAIIVNAEGKVANAEKNVKVKLKQQSANTMVDKAIYCTSNLDISGMKVMGDVQSAGDIQISTNGSNKFEGKYTAHSPRYYALAPFPILTPHSPSIIDVKNTNYTISGTGYYFQSITVKNGTITFRPTGSVMKIVADDITIDSDLNIDESVGRVELYINNSLTVTNKGVINNTEPHNLIIYLKDGSNFYMQANKTLNAYVIGPEATMQIQSNHSTTNGALITNILQKNATGNGPNGAVNYVPLPSGFDIEENLIAYEIVSWEE